MKKYFITSAGTDAGKTFVLTKFIEKLIANGKKVKAIKPIISGLDMDSYISREKSDSASILRSLNKEINKENITDISKFIFKPALAPTAKEITDKHGLINYKKLLDFCQDFLIEDSDYAFIEGAGGMFVPINKNKLIIDLIEDLVIEVIIISNNYLGSISHNLSLLEMAKNRGLKVKKLILNDIIGDRDFLLDNVKNIANFSQVKIEHISCQKDPNFESDIDSVLRTADF
jgi:dethiobiotin synthetase